MASPAEQRFRIRFETTANTQGAKAAADAMRQTAAATTQAAQSTQRAADSARAAATATASHTAAVNANATATRAATTEATRFAQANQAAARTTNQPGARGGAAPRSAGPAGPAGRPGRGARPGGAAPASGGGRGAGGGGGADASDWGGAALEFARAFEDAQYGIGGVVNNIPGLIAALGGGAGLAGVLSVTAVMAAQLVKNLSKIGDTFDAEKAAAELAKVQEVVDKMLEKSGKDAAASFVAQMAEARQAWESNLEAWQRAKASIAESGASADADAAAKSSATQAAIDMEGALAGDAQEPAVAELMKRQAADAARLAEDQRLQAERERAVQEMEVAKNGIITARENRAAATQGLEDLPQLRQDIINEMEAAGIKSDEVRFTTDYHSKLNERDTLNNLATKAEHEAATMPIRTDDDRFKKASLERQAAQRRKKAGALNDEVMAMQPEYDAAWQRVLDGTVSYDGVDTAKLTTKQKQALAKGKSALEKVPKTEADLKDQVKKANEEEAAAAKALEEANKRQREIRNQQDRVKLQRTAESYREGELPTDAPEDVGQALARQREVSGRDAVPMLPGALPPPLDVSPQTSTVGQAMEQQASAVSSAMTAMADRTAQIAGGVVQAKQTIEARMAALEQQLQALRTLP